MTEAEGRALGGSRRTRESGSRFRGYPGLGVLRARGLSWWAALGLLGVVILVVSRGMGPGLPGAAVEPGGGGPASTAGTRPAGSGAPASPSSGGHPAAGVAQGPLDAAAYEARLEAALAAALSRIQGAGRVWVDVTLDDGGEAVPVTNTNRTARTTEETDASGTRRSVSETAEDSRVVTVRDAGAGGEQPVLVGLRPPAIRGVLVVAEGAADPRVREWLYRATATQLGVPFHRILVLPMEGGG